MRRLIAMRVLVGAVVIALLGSCGGDSGSSTPAVTITAATPPAGTLGQAYAGYIFLATGGVPPMSWTSSGSLPPGLSFDSTGQLSGTPTTGGSYNFSVTVTDSSRPALTATTPVSVKITESQIVVAPASPPAGIVTYPYGGFSFNASGGSPPYTWTSSGSLPPGITLGSDGTLSGTPTQTGSFSFSVTATDSAQPPVSGPPLATNIQINPPATLTLNQAPAPPDGIQGTSYGPFSFSTTGGYQPLHWSITQGTLPAGIVLGGSDGSLVGTPTSTGTFTFTVTVTDSASPPVHSSQSFSFNVALPPPPVITYTEPPTGTVGVSYAPLLFAANGGLMPLAWSETPPLSMGLTLSSAGVLSGTPTTAGQFQIMLNVQDALSRAAIPLANTVRVSMARPAAAFAATGSLAIPRSGHAATLLLSGKVLVTGGGHGTPDATAELYDPATASFTPSAGNMTEARGGHTATLLKLSSATLANYGKVLIVGSADQSAELYDPNTSTFAVTGSMHHARTSPTATLLGTNKVLIVGGNTTSGDLTAELYDPTSGTFSDTGSATALRSGHTATLLVSGQVLITGGGSNTAELYDPTHGTFTATTGTMSEARSGHTATLLAAGSEAGQAGDVLIVGIDGSADLYDPNTELFTRVGSLYTAVPQSSPGHSASLRTDGTVLVAGGHTNRACRPVFFAPVSKSGAALFAPESDGFTDTGALKTARDSHTATVLDDGAILIVGGTDHFLSYSPFRCTSRATVLSSAELFR
jgi:hypothetical protein